MTAGFPRFNSLGMKVSVMNEDIQQKIRDLKMKIARAERELTATRHNSGLAAALRTGHAGQLAKAAERDRLRLETRIEELRTKLAALLEPADSSPDPAEKAAEAPAPAVEKVQKKAAGAKAPAAAKPKKTTSGKKSS
jgi:hypothetical protein